MDQILNAVDALLTKGARDDGVVVQSESLSVDLAEAALVDKLADGVTSGVTIGDVRLDHADHVDGSAVELDEDTVVELSQTEELHDLLGLGWELVDTSGSDNESNLGLGLNVEIAVLLGSTLGIDEGLVGIGVLFGVLGGCSGSGGAGCGTSGLSGGTLIGHLLEELGVSLGLLEDVLRDVPSRRSWGGLGRSSFGRCGLGSFLCGSLLGGSSWGLGSGLRRLWLLLGGPKT